MTLIEKYNLVSDDFKTAKEIGLAAATLGALVRRGFVEATNTSPKKYRKVQSPAAKIYLLLDENKDDYDTYFTLRKSNAKIGMLCSVENNTIVDCWGTPYNLENVIKIEFKTRVFNL